MRSKLYALVAVPLAVIALTAITAVSHPDVIEKGGVCFDCHDENYLQIWENGGHPFFTHPAHDGTLIINAVFEGCNGNFAKYRIDVQDKYQSNPQGKRGWGIFNGSGPDDLQRVAFGDSGGIFNMAVTGNTYAVIGVDRNKNQNPNDDGYWNFSFIDTNLLVELCLTAGDDDCDGLANYQDPEGCCTPGPLGEICDNENKDEDCDGLANYQDPQGCCEFSSLGEICGDYIDNDCDGLADPNDPEGCPCSDMDGDNFFAESDCGTLPDCDDGAPDINPGNVWYLDQDGDGYRADPDIYGLDVAIKTGCQPPGEKYHRELPGGLTIDCNDEEPEVFSPTVWYRDNDGDGYGADPDKYSNVTITGCDRPAKYYLESELEGGINIDCNEYNKWVHPDTVWHRDRDRDHYGARYDKYPDATITQCERPSDDYFLESTLTVNRDCRDDNINLINCYVLKIVDDTPPKAHKVDDPPKYRKLHPPFPIPSR